MSDQKIDPNSENEVILETFQCKFINLPYFSKSQNRWCQHTIWDAKRECICMEKICGMEKTEFGYMWYGKNCSFS